MSKTFIWFCLFIGSSLCGYLPCLFGAEMLSLWTIIGSVMGGVVGIFAGNKLGEMLGA